MQPVPDSAAATPGPWTNFWQNVVRFEAEKIDFWLALRNSVGIVLPLVVATETGAIGSGVVMATGALNVAFSDNRDAYAQRGQRMLLASVVVAFAVFIGELSGQNLGLAVLVSAMWAFAAGMLVSVSATAADIGVISLVTIVVFMASPQPMDRAIASGFLAFGGGLLQTVLALALWPLRRYEPERRAIGELYVSIAKSIQSTVSASQAPPASAQSTAAHQALASRTRDHSVEGERIRALLNQAERIRLSLLVLGHLRSRMHRECSNIPQTLVLDGVFSIAARLLDSIGQSLLTGTPVTDAGDCLAELEAASQKLRQGKEDLPSLVGAMVQDARVQVDALSGQLRSAVDLGSHVTPAGQLAFRQKEAGQPWTLRLGGRLATLRANLTLQSAACRHAIRLAVCVALGDALARGQGWRRSYWVPMTIAIVLKPDFTATFSRGVLRLTGTFVGLLLSTALFHTVNPTGQAQVVLIAIWVFVLRYFGPANYGILVTAVTAFVVLLIALTGVAPKEVMTPRGLNTAVGGLIALVAYWVWPTWEHKLVPEMLAKMLDAYRAYFRAVRESYIHNDQPLSPDLDRTRLAGRLARSNLEASVDRLHSEPRTPPETLSLLSTILANSHRLAHAMMALEAGLHRSRPVPARPAFKTLADHAELTLYYLAAALRGSPLTVSQLPDLREDHHALVQSADPLTERYALVNVETDRVTNSLNSLSEEVVQLMTAFRDPPSSSGNRA